MTVRALLLSALIFMPALCGGANAPLPADSIYQLPATLTDAGGHAREWRALRGKPRVVSMFYTSCQYVCPLIVDSMRAVERGLSSAERERIGFVLVSMDPVRDTPAVLASVAKGRHLDPSAWQLLQPKPAEVRAIAGVLGVRYRASGDGEFNHTSTLVLLDAEGRVLARTERLGGQGDPDFLAAVRRAVDRGQK